jgi:hypothetical protein
LLDKLVVTQRPIAQLVILISGGVAIYLALLALFARRQAAFLLSHLPASRITTGRPAAQ